MCVIVNIVKTYIKVILCGGELLVYMWFDKRDTESAKIHYVAYYKSIELKKCLKISPGHYYFRGYEITYIEDRPHSKKWGIAKVSN